MLTDVRHLQLIEVRYIRDFWNTFLSPDLIVVHEAVIKFQAELLVDFVPTLLHILVNGGEFTQ